MTLDNVRAALRDPQPWTAFDQLVRAEQSAGRTVRAIHDELLALVEPVREAENPPEDADDAMMDTLDALAGNCHPKWRYYDPPTLPTEEEVGGLPRKARVAYAARCARRMLPRFDLFSPGAELDYRNAVEAAVRVAEYLAWMDGEAAPAPAEAYLTGPDNRGFIDGADEISGFISRYGESRWNVGRIAHAAAAELVDGTSVADAAILAAESVRDVADITAELRRDYDRLVALARHNRWSDYTPVSQDVFGPLWPEGPPAGWPADPDVPQRAELPLTAVAREGVTPGVFVDEVVNLFNALNRYHIARTGRRLTLEGDVHTRLAALVPAGAA